MKAIKDLIFGFSDAENYKRRENKMLFDRLFMHNNFLNDITKSSTTFLIGDKGTGKTAYAVYMSNNDYMNTLSSLRYIRETEYQKFITLKNEKHLELSDYSSIWKVIVYLLLSEDIHRKEKKNALFERFTKLHCLHKAINEYYNNAFSPEIIYALNFIQESKLAAELLSKHTKGYGDQKDTMSFTEKRFQTNLFYIQKKFENVLKSLKLDRNYILFIDGIDIRPDTVPYNEYINCIKGLANAVWEVNNDFFPSIRDSKGRLRVILLIRPDIFASLGLQNQNTKLRDNSVILNWLTTYREHRKSDLFAMVDKLLSFNQSKNDQLKFGDAWDYYFPYDTPNLKVIFEKPSSFVGFLRFALYRPRDIITMLLLLQEKHISTSNSQNQVFSFNDFDNSVFKRNYSNYLLGEVKDQLSFYYSNAEYEMFLKFFVFLKGKNKFSYKEYLEAYKNLEIYLNQINMDIPKFMANSSDFLQFLYELNIICYIERTEANEPFIHWSFKDRTYSNISPKVKEGQEYEIFYGLAKALNTGQRFKNRL